ncbi:MAG: HEAT repeat domain-containing protein [Planctomycetota bacterium]|nr:HEAT repeat domain-containing protein [Planctomycetota bacterium]
MRHLALVLCLLLAACAGDEATSGSRQRDDAAAPPDPSRIRLGDQRQVEMGSLSAADKMEIERAWRQFLARSPVWRVSLRSIVSRGGAGPYVLSENLFRHFFTASIHSRKSEINRVASSAAVIGEPAAAYFAKPLVEDLVPLGKAVVAEVPDPNDPSARIKKTFHHFQIDDFTRRDAARVLIAIGEPAVPTLASPELLERARPSGRRYAAFALGRIGNDAAVAALERHLATATDWQDRAAAVQGLGAALRKNERVRPILERAARDPDPFVQRKAEEALRGRTKLPF